MNVATRLFTATAALAVTGASPGVLTSTPAPAVSIRGELPALNYGGRATVVQVDANLMFTTLTSRWGDAGFLPPSGGTVEWNTPSASLPGVFSVGATSARSFGGNENSLSVASVDHFFVTVAGDTISGGMISSSANANCFSGTPRTGGGTTIGVLIINRQVTALTGNHNQVIDLPNGVGKIIIDEQLPTVNSLTVTAIHITAGLLDIRIDRSFASIVCGP